MSNYNKIREIKKLISDGICLCGHGESCDWCSSRELRAQIRKIIDREDKHPVRK